MWITIEAEEMQKCDTQYFPFKCEHVEMHNYETRYITILM